MLITVDPVLLALGPFAVRPFGLLSLVGLVVGVWLSVRALARADLPTHWLLDATAWGVPAGIVFGRVVAVVGSWDYYVGHAGEMTQLDVAGLSLAGGVWGGGLIACARLRAHTAGDGTGERRRRLLDAVVPMVLISVALGQLGAFLEGAGQGQPTDLPWATRYASPFAAAPDVGVARHPVQLYTLVGALVLYSGLRAVPRVWPAGTRTALGMILGGGAWAALGLVRLDPAFLFGVQIDQWLAALAAAIGLGQLTRVGVWHRRNTAAGKMGEVTLDPDAEARREQSAGKEGSMAA